MALPDDLFFFFFFLHAFVFLFLDLSLCLVITLDPPPPWFLSSLLFGYSSKSFSLSQSSLPLHLSFAVVCHSWSVCSPFLSSTLSAPTSISAILFSVSIFLSIRLLLSVIGRRASDWGHMKDLNEHREKTHSNMLSCSPLSHFTRLYLKLLILLHNCCLSTFPWQVQAPFTATWPCRGNLYWDSHKIIMTN